MRILIPVLIIVLSSLFAKAQTTLLFQDFNQGFPVGWQLIDNDQNTPNASPSVSFITDAFVIHEDYDSTGIGDSIVVATSWFETSGTADDYIITPAVTLGSTGNKLSFDSKSIDGSYPDGLQILYSTGDLNSWTFIANDTLFESYAVSNTWTNYTVSLDTILSNQTVYIAFRHIATDQFILGLDNIKIETGNMTSLSENEMNLLNLYPNPADNSIHVSVKESSNYTIYSITGKKVNSGITSGNIYLELPNGFYLLEVGKQMIRFQIIN